MPPSRPGSELNVWWHLGRLTVGTVLGLTMRIRAYGAANLPRTGPALLAANHLSFLDPPVIGLVVSDFGRSLHFLTAAELFNVPLVGWGMRMIGQIPVKRGAADRAALEDLGAVVRNGGLAGIFPEGRRRDPNERLRGSKGVARIALAAGVPVIPVGLWGTHLKWPRKGGPKLFPLRPHVAVCFGPPVPPKGDLASRADVRALTDRVMGEIGTLENEAMTRALA